MKINQIIQTLEAFAAPSLQEEYDNAGLLTGQADWDCTGAIICLDATEAVILEAVEKQCNLVIAHHPIVFGGLKQINGKNYVEKAVIAAIKNDIAIYAIHTNLDNVLHGVNGRIADELGLVNRTVLVPRQQSFKKLQVFVPLEQAGRVREAIFSAGAGNINNYSECSFNTAGKGSFKPGVQAQPFLGAPGNLQQVDEIKIEAVFSPWLEVAIVTNMKKAHPYEEPAFDILTLDNPQPGIGSGLLGYLPDALEESIFLKRLQAVFGTPVIKHTALTGRQIRKVALCGGAGSFLTGRAIAAGADCYVTADIKYHEFFDANGCLLLADIGHFESEQFTISLLRDILQEKFPTFAALKTAVNTNPVHYQL
jgi:dinuclear metal center YbgI/SA1388 family protein